MTHHRFEIVQEGIVVAAVDAPSFHDGLREIAHYARQYEQDGPIKLRHKPPKPRQSWYCDQCAVEVYQLRCQHCGKTKRERT